MAIPSRINRYKPRHALVDGIPFTIPVSGNKSPVLMAMLECGYAEAQKLLPGTELFDVRLLNGKAVFVVTVVNYIDTTIGKYV